MSGCTYQKYQNVQEENDQIRPHVCFEQRFFCGVAVSSKYWDTHLQSPLAVASGKQPLKGQLCCLWENNKYMSQNIYICLFLNSHICLLGEIVGLIITLAARTEKEGQFKLSGNTFVFMTFGVILFWGSWSKLPYIHWFAFFRAVRNVNWQKVVLRPVFIAHSETGNSAMLHFCSHATVKQSLLWGSIRFCGVSQTHLRVVFSVLPFRADHVCVLTVQHIQVFVTLFCISSFQL